MALILAFSAVLGGCAKADEELSMPAFRDAFRAEVRRERPSATIDVVADNELNVSVAGKGSSSAYMDNAYARYRADPGHLADVLRAYVSALLETAGSPAFTADNLIILVRPESYVAVAPRGLLARRIAGELMAVVAIDRATSYAFEPPDRLRSALNLDEKSIWARALANTLAHFPTHAPDPAPSHKPAAISSDGAGSESSLLVDDAYWDAPAMQQNGAPVVAPVAKDLLVVTHEGDAAGIAEMRAVAAMSAQDPDGLSPNLFVRRDHAWVLLAP